LSGIFIHDNTYSNTDPVNTAAQPELIQQILFLLLVSGIEQPQIVMDGLLMGENPVCIQEMDASFVNINAGDATFMSVTTDRSAQDCVQESLPEISFTPF